MKRLWVLVLLFAIGCATNPVTHRVELSFLSVSGEKKLGRKFVTMIDRDDLSQGPFIREGFAVEYLQKIVDSFMPFYERRGEMPVTVVISPTAVPNAWSIPGYININLGIIPCLKSEAELAFVLGHELGHIAARHTAERYTQSIIFSLGVQGVSLYGGQIANLVGNVVAALYLATYSRSQERMADDLGFKYMTSAGYDPWGSYNAMQDIEACGNEYMKALGIKRLTGIAGFLERIFADHPSTKERLKRLKARIEAANKTGEESFYDYFSKLKEWAAERKAVLVKLDKARYLLKSGKKKKAVEIADKAVSEIKPDFEPEIRAKIYSMAGYINLVAKNYEKAWGYALRATEEDRDYYVAYKIAGIAGLRSATKDGLIVAENAFTECLERKLSDPEYKLAFGKEVVDRVCLKGVIISSCKLGRKKCRYYCKYYIKNFGGLSVDLVPYCAF